MSSHGNTVVDMSHFRSSLLMIRAEISRKSSTYLSAACCVNNNFLVFNTVHLPSYLILQCNLLIKSIKAGSQGYHFSSIIIQLRAKNYPFLRFKVLESALNRE